MGATSGIGREVAVLLSQNGYNVAVAGRREELLRQLVAEYDAITQYKVIDINAEDAPHKLNELINSMGGIDLYFHSSGIGYQNPNLDIDKEMRTVETNAMGFARIINNVYHYFEEKGSAGV